MNGHQQLYSLCSVGEITMKPVKKGARYSNISKSQEELTVRDCIKCLGRSKNTAATEVPLSKQRDQSFVANRRAS